MFITICRTTKHISSLSLKYIVSVKYTQNNPLKLLGGGYVPSSKKLNNSRYMYLVFFHFIFKILFICSVYHDFFATFADHSAMSDLGLHCLPASYVSHV